jgi:hypothetical protein
VFHISFYGLNQIWDEVIAPRKLDIDLRKRIFDAVTKIDQTIVNAYRIHQECGRNCEEYQK